MSIIEVETSRKLVSKSSFPFSLVSSKHFKEIVRSLHFCALSFSARTPSRRPITLRARRLRFPPTLEQKRCRGTRHPCFATLSLSGPSPPYASLRDPSHPRPRRAALTNIVGLTQTSASVSVVVDAVTTANTLSPPFRALVPVTTSHFSSGHSRYRARLGRV